MANKIYDPFVVKPKEKIVLHDAFFIKKVRSDNKTWDLWQCSQCGCEFEKSPSNAGQTTSCLDCKKRLVLRYDCKF